MSDMMGENLVSPRRTIEIIKKYEFTFRKKFGQNFLIDERVIGRIIEAADLTQEDCVLEIGPGIGALTQYLAGAAGQVVAVEIDQKLIQKTLDTINRYNVDGKYLEIEITESCFHENYAALEDFVKIMHENGIRVSLDDFGTGYSSLSMFKNLELDVIKLDKSFFDDLDEKGDTDRVILESISKMINRLNKISVSEGVETEEQLKFAKQIGSDIIQGFYFDRPLNFEDFTRRLKIRTYETQKVEK